MTSLPGFGRTPLADFLRQLVTLRWLGILGQAITIAVVLGPMAVPLDARPLWMGVALLVVFNAYGMLRVRQSRPAPPLEVFLHMLVDIAVLTWQIGWSGGIENPFSSLFLLPIALAILALPAAWVGAVAAASILGFGASAILGPALPHVHSMMGDAFSLHKVGMLVNFAVSALVLLVFLTRIAMAWRKSESELARLREQFTRNEGILALATHAASVAHELNTPLGTMTLMVDELLAEPGAAPIREDLGTLKTLLGQCRDRVFALAAPAHRGAGSPLATGVDLEQVIEGWQLVRPVIDLRRQGSLAGQARVDPAVGHLLQALLNNAADAGEQVGRTQVDLRLEMREGRLHGEIRDHGIGFDLTQPLLPGTLYRSSKPEGLGIGLALSHATVERLGGRLTMHAAAEGTGVRVVFELPVERAGA